MTGSSTSKDAILAAARRAIAERGPGRVTLSAVAASAGVSRPTLYRWFPTKDDLLAAISRYEEEQFDLGLRAVIAAHRSPARRLDAALRYLVTYLDESMGAEAIGVDSHFALQWLARSLPAQRESLARMLADALQQVPAARRGELSNEQTAELFLRIAYSHYLIPHPEPEVLLANARSFAGLPRRSMVRATG